MSPTEHRHRLAFAERQWEHFRLRAMQAQIRAQLAIAMGDHVQAERQLQAARNHLDFVNDCNESIDTSRRALEPGDI